MSIDDKITVLMASTIGTWLIFMCISPTYREDTFKAFRLEDSSIKVLLKHPFQSVAIVLSFVVPAYFLFEA